MPAGRPNHEPATTVALGLVCRLRSRYLLHSVRDAARANDYRVYTTLNARAAAEAELFARQLDSLKAQPMHKHMRRADYVLHCDASDHALTPSAAPFLLLVD